MGRKWDFCIGNPAYQAETVGDNSTYAPQIYNYFIDESYKIADKVELIHPGRFLFDAGSTPKSWNKKMLTDPHLKILMYEANASSIFPKTNINGGVVVTYHNNEKKYGAIGVFTAYSELNSLLQKVRSNDGFKGMDEIVVSRTAYRLTEVMHDEHPEAISQLSDGHPYDMSTNIFERLPQLFFPSAPDDGFQYIRILGRVGNERTIKWVRKEYVSGPSNLGKYKVVMSSADGAAGTVGKPVPARIIGAPTLSEPWIGNTESFISIGSFETEGYGKNALCYVKTKFARVLLGVLKVTQHITPDKWKYVPLQDFSSNSDINWNTSIANIDRQLYKKYGLSQEEINFIESHVKEMT